LGLRRALQLSLADYLSSDMGPPTGTSKQPKGRMTAYAYFVKSFHDERKKGNPNANLTFGEQSKQCSDLWKTLSEDQKKQYKELQEWDKKRFDHEMKDYVPPAGGKRKRGQKVKRTKDPNAPKRALSSFFWFCNDERPKVKGLNPDYGIGEVAKELGKLWREISPSEKERYEVMAARGKARYAQEMEAYKKGTTAVPSKMEEYDDDEEEDDDEDDEWLDLDHIIQFDCSHF